MGKSWIFSHKFYLCIFRLPNEIFFKIIRTGRHKEFYFDLFFRLFFFVDAPFMYYIFGLGNELSRICPTLTSTRIQIRMATGKSKFVKLRYNYHIIKWFTSIKFINFVFRKEKKRVAASKILPRSLPKRRVRPTKSFAGNPDESD